MSNFSESQIIEFYKSIGLSEKDYLINGRLVDLFTLLKTAPEVNVYGNRAVSPYEILRVPPKFEDGEERPIVFAIKNKAKKVGKYEGGSTNFLYEAKKIKEEKSFIQELKSKYRRAVFFGNQLEAEEIMSTLKSIDPKEASDLASSFYDYTKFYKKMKEQLLLNLFAHFFILFVSYKKEYEAEAKKQAELGETVRVKRAPNPSSFGLKNLKKVVIQTQDKTENFNFKNKKQTEVSKVKKEENFSQQTKSAAVVVKEEKTETPDMFKKKKRKGVSFFNFRKRLRKFSFDQNERVDESSSEPNFDEISRAEDDRRRRRREIEMNEAKTLENV
ncbi:MAG: hypothetical protein IJ538_01525 [Clostridia bacterium]|nr:hypothetical protein [Clostridia bacterium]